MKTIINKTTNLIILSIFCFICISLCLTPRNLAASETYKFVRMWPVIEQPWYFYFPEDVCVDNEGFVYIADKKNNCIQKFTSDGQFVDKWGKEGTGDNEMHYPSGIAADNSGFLYVTDSRNNRILKFTDTGKFVAKWGSKGSGNDQLNLPRGIAVYAGIVYVADVGNNRIQVFEQDGNHINQWPGEEYGFIRANGVETDAQGFVYVSDSKNNIVIKFSSDGEKTQEWNNIVNSTDTFDSPLDIAVDNNGFVYVTNLNNHSIRKYDSSGIFIKEWGGQGRNPGKFDEPCGIAVDKNGYIYVVDRANNRIQKFAPNAQFLIKWGTGNGQGELSSPNGIDMDGQGNILVADTENFRIQKFDQNGKYIEQWGSEGTGPDEFLMPSGLVVGSDDSIYVVDANNVTNGYIREFTDQGQPENQWGTDGNSLSQFSLPQDLAVLSSGLSGENDNDLIFVADRNNNRIQKFNADGTFIEEWNSFDNGNDTFKYPRGITSYIDEENNGFIYVSDTGNHRILMFNENGTLINQWGEPGNADGAFHEEDGPFGIAPDSHGNIYVADPGNHRIQKFDQNGNFITKWGTPGTDPGQLNEPGSMTIGPDNKVYVSDTKNHRIQVFEKTGETLNNKAVIVAGGGSYLANYLWDATRMCTNFAYRTLTYQGFTKNDIFYLTEDTHLDLDNNGIADDTDGVPTPDNLKNAISDWAKDVDNLIFYLTDHGGDKNFRINRNETISASELDSWLDQVQETIAGKVIVIYDACESGSFLSELTPPPGKERIVIGSTSIQENAYFIFNGSISFSNYFWTDIFTGTDIFSAFETAAKAIGLTAKSQHPVLDDNNDGIFNESDGLLAEDSFIGNGEQISSDSPVLGKISVSPEQSTVNSALIKVEEVFDNDGIARVWAAIQPPGFTQGESDNTLQGLPSAELIPKEDGIYEAIYDNFSISGTYKILVYAKDRKGNTSVPKIETFDTDDPLRSKAVIIAGGPETGDLWTGVKKNAELAYQTLRFQGYSDDDIVFISPDNSSQDVDMLPALANLEATFETGLGNNIKNLVFYMIGKTEDKGFRLNNAEILTSGELDIWLDSLQDNIPGEIIVICDTFLSSSFIEQLTAPEDKLRILISSTSGIQPASFASNGVISFSRYFWNRIINGSDLYSSFIYAKNAIEIAGQGQVPQLDDNGNGKGNEQTDGTLAQGILLGAGIYLTGNAPLAQELIPDKVLNGETTAAIRVENISTTGKIEKVWAVINPPSNFNLLQESNIDLPIVKLNENQGAYQGNYNDFHYYGKYNVTIYAQDTKGNISTPMSSIIFQNQGPDVYEQDDNETQAGIITLGLSDVEKDSEIQRHNFHKPGDEDWVKFYAFPGVLYEIKTTNPDNKSDTIITLYDRDKTIIKNENRKAQTGELLSWTFKTGGIYYLKITHANPDVFGADTGYDLLIYRPIGPVAGFISGNVTDAATGQPITGAIITSSANASALSLPGGNFLMIQEPGTSISVTVNVQGYEPYSTMMTLEQGGISRLDLSLTPIMQPEPVEPDTIPEASIISPESDLTIDPGQTVDFQANYTSGNAPHSFAWDFGGAGEDSSELNPPEIIFDSPGVYEITFTVTDADGDADTASRTITIKETPTDNKPPEPEEPDVSPEPGIKDIKPLASIISPLPDTEISAGESIDFDAEVSGGNAPLIYSWDFDGAAENVQTKTPGNVIFYIPGEYTITLTLTDADGDTDSKTINIKVKEKVTQSEKPEIPPPGKEQDDEEPDSKAAHLTLPLGPESENVGGFGCFINLICHD